MPSGTILLIIMLLFRNIDNCPISQADSKERKSRADIAASFQVDFTASFNMIFIFPCRDVYILRLHAIEY